MIYVSLCCLTNRYWSNIKLIPMLYNYNTNYTTNHSAEFCDVAIIRTSKSWLSFNWSDGLTVMVVATWSGQEFFICNSRIALFAARVSQCNWNQPWHTPCQYPLFGSSFGRYGDLIKHHEVPLFRMLHDILDDNHIQWDPPLVRRYTNFCPCYWYGPNLNFYLIEQGFLRTFSTGATCQQRTLTPHDTWSWPTLGLASVLMLRPISSETCFQNFEFRTSLVTSVCLR